LELFQPQESNRLTVVTSRVVLVNGTGGTQIVERAEFTIEPPEDIGQRYPIVFRSRVKSGVFLVDNILGAWPDDGITSNETFILKVEIEPELNPLPEEFVVWNTLSVATPPDNTLIATNRRVNPGIEQIIITVPPAGVTNRVVIHLPDVGPYDEAAFALNHPIMASLALYYGSVAQDYAEGLQGPGVDDQYVNAIQHSYWTALMAADSVLESGGAIMASDAHERSNRLNGGTAGDSVMDIRNNYIGTLSAGTNALAELDARWLDGDLYRTQSNSIMIIKSNGQKVYPLH